MHGQVKNFLLHKLNRKSGITNFLFLISLLLGALSAIYAQNPERQIGFPFIRNHTSEEYRASFNNRAIVQDQRGIMYIGNEGGVLEYDGVSWRFIPIPNESIVYSLALDRHGKIYVGGGGEFGYLTPDSVGQMHYISLKDVIKLDSLNFANVLEIYITEEGMYLQTDFVLFRWSQEAVKTWMITNVINTFHVGSKIYIYQNNVGLMEIVDDTLQLVPGGEFFSDKAIYSMLKYPDHNSNSTEFRLLIGTYQDGLFFYDGDSAERFDNEADVFLRNNRIYYGTIVNEGIYAYGTDQGGVAIIDLHGNLLQILDKSRGLLHNKAGPLYVDHAGSLWIMVYGGISHVEFISPISIYDERNGLDSDVTSVMRHQNELYVATSGHVYQVRGSECHAIKGPFECGKFLLDDDRMMVPSRDGIYQIKNQQAIQIRADRAHSLFHSTMGTDRIYVGLYETGFIAMELVDGVWIEDERIEGIPESIAHIVEIELCKFWLETEGNIVLRVNLQRDDKLGCSFKNPEIKRFDERHGLPSGKVYIRSIADQIVFCTRRGIFGFDERSGTFSPDTTLGEKLGYDGGRILNVIEDNHRNIWVEIDGEWGKEWRVVIRDSDGTYRWRPSPLYYFNNFTITAVYHDVNDVIWVGLNDHRLIRIDSKISENPSARVSVLMRRVSTHDDSVIFGGGWNQAPFTPVLDHRNNSLRFDFSVPEYDYGSLRRFQWILEGFDKGWSSWSKRTEVDYINLPAGKYTFRVRSSVKDELFDSETSFTFEIRPPWFAVWWMFGFYFLIFMGIVFGIVKWRSWKLEKEKRILEQTVTERTREVAVKNRQLEEQAEKLKEMDQLKTRFFANISHEFRTPLTLIMDPLKKLRSRNFQGEYEQLCEMMLHNSNRLMLLINQLLDLAILEKKEMGLHASFHKIAPFLKGIVNSFHSLADSKNISLRFTEKQKNIECYFDWDKLEKIACNLLMNAFRFTPEGGEIVVTVAERNDDMTMFEFLSKDFSDGAVEIAFRDTGIGIPEDSLPYVFNRFFHVDSSQTRVHEGYGIGLALSKELVELHHGTIDVKSKPNGGTKFIVYLPKGKKHLNSDEIVSHTGVFEEKIEVEAIESHETLQLSLSQMEQLTIDQTGPDMNIDNNDSSKVETIVLIVEDNDDMRTYLHQCLSPFYKILEAQNGEEGVEIALETIPDLVISDVMMPKMDGYELCQILKRDRKTSHIPIVLLTVRASDDHKIEGLEKGADDYIIKPFSSIELLTRIKNLIKLRRHLQNQFRQEIVLPPTKITIQPLDKEFIEETINVIEEYISDSDFSVEIIHHKVGMSRSSFHRKLRALIDQSPSQFVRLLRLKHAAELLHQNNGTITEIAFSVGFTNSAYFAKCFKELYGQSPSEYRSSQFKRTL